MAWETHVTRMLMEMADLTTETTAQPLPTGVRRTWMEMGLGTPAITVQRKGTKTKVIRTGMGSEMLAARMPTVTESSTSRTTVLRWQIRNKRTRMAMASETLVITASCIGILGKRTVTTTWLGMLVTVTMTQIKTEFQTRLTTVPSMETLTSSMGFLVKRMALGMSVMTMMGFLIFVTTADWYPTLIKETPTEMVRGTHVRTTVTLTQSRTVKTSVLATLPSLSQTSQILSPTMWGPAVMGRHPQVGYSATVENRSTRS